MTTAKQCIDVLVQKHGRPREEAERIVNEMLEARETLAPDAKANDLVKKMTETYDAERMANLKNRQRMAKNIEIFREIPARFAELKKQFPKIDFVDFMEAELMGLEQRIPGARASVASDIVALNRLYQGRFTQQFEKLGEKYGKSRNYIFDILGDVDAASEHTDFFRELYSPGSSGNAMMAEVATVWRAGAEELRVRDNRAGANIGSLDMNWFPQTHDATKLNPDTKGNYAQEWVRFISPLLNWEKTLAGVAEKDRANVLTDIFQTITTNRDLETHFQDYRTFRPTGGGQSHRILHFKDGESAYAYQQKYGRGSVLFAMDNHVRQASRRIALREKFGWNPDSMVYRLIDSEKSRLRYALRNENLSLAERAKIQKEEKRLNAYYKSEGNMPVGKIANWMKVLTGETDSIVNVTGAQVGSALRAFNTISKLGLAGAASVGDFHTISSMQRIAGVSMGERIADTVNHVKRYKGREREIAQELGMLTQTSWGNALSRFDLDDPVPGAITKTVNRFLRWSGINFMQEQGKARYALSVSRNYGRARDLSFKDLDSTMRGLLEYHGFDEKSWNVMRNMMERHEGEWYLNASLARNLTESQVKHLMPERLRGNTPPEKMTAEEFTAAKQRALQDIQWDVEKKVLGFFADNTMSAVLESDLKVKAVTTMGNPRGTMIGEILRAAFQFKSWPISYWQRTMKGQAWRKHGAPGYDIPGALQFAITALGTGFAINALQDLAKGKTPRDVSKMETWYAAAWKAGFGGLLGDFVFGPTAAQGGEFADMVLGPTGGIINDLAPILGQIPRGEFEKVGKELAKTAMGNAPFMNLWAVKAVSDYFLFNGWKEYLNPGYNQRTRRRMREQGQRYLWE